MKIAVIGTGNIGAAYARTLAEAKYEVIVGDRDPGKAAALAREIGVKAEGGGIAAAFKLADLVILAVPYQATAGVLAEAGDLVGKVLVDVSNPISEDFKDLVVGLTTSGAKGARTGRTLALGLIGIAPGETMAQTCARTFTVEIAGTHHQAQALARPPFDPAGERMKA